MTEFEAYATLQKSLINGGCSPDEAHRLIAAYDNARHGVMEKQVAEIHEFVSGLAGALNSPMVKSMLPPNMRGMLGG